MRGLVSIGVWLALTACGGNAEDKGEPQPSAPPRAAPVVKERATKPVAKPFDADAFCQAVFPMARVGEGIGVTGLAPQAAPRPPALGTAECHYAKYVDRPLAQVSAVFDCRPQHPRLSATVARLLKVDKGRHYRDVSVGDGGAYTKDEANNNYQELVFIADDPGCTVYVSTAYLAADHLEVLAGMAAELLTDANAPRM